MNDLYDYFVPIDLIISFLWKINKDYKVINNLESYEMLDNLQKT